MPPRRNVRFRWALLPALIILILCAVLLYTGLSVWRSRDSGLPPTLAQLESRGEEDAPARLLAPASPESEWFYYHRLGEEERTVYAEMLAAMQRREEVLLSSNDTELMGRVFQCVMADHPELFYVSGYTATQYATSRKTLGYGFSGRYLYEEEEILRRSAALEEAVGRILGGVPEEADAYALVKYVYETLIRNTVYDDGAPDDQNICSVFLEGRSICMGYARATQFLLQRLGMEAALVTGTADTGLRSDEPHAWDLVRVDGEWYYVDTTWGDASFATGGETLSGISYEYLLASTEDLSATHRADSPVELPDCSSTQANYFVREGAYLTEADTDAFTVLARRRIEAGEDCVSCKCATREVYEELCRKLFDEQEIFRCLGTAPGGSIRYLRSDRSRTVTVWL